jgi:hypothetical protein
VKRFHQFILIGSLLLLSWLAMMVVHEFGHVVGAWLTGSTIAKVVAQHGEWGFRTYTNARGVLYHDTRIDPDLRYPPYSSEKTSRELVAS